jgi:DNA polymerase-3 subunit beta
MGGWHPEKGTKPMKLTAPVSSLAAAMAVTVAAVEKRNTIPVLSNVLLIADHCRLTIVASDLDMEVTTHIAADVSETGEITANAATLLAALKKFGKTADAHMSIERGSLIVTSGKSRVQVATLLAEEFPRMNSGDFDAEFTCGSADIARLIGKTIFAASTEAHRTSLCGVYLHTDGSTLATAATDGHRLAFVSSPVEAEIPPVILPVKAAQHVLRLLDGTNFPVDVSVSANKIRFVFGETAIMSKLIDGTFPEYKRVIPQGAPISAVCASADLARAIDTASIVADQTSSACVLKIGTDGTAKVTMHGANNQSAEDETEMECDHEYAVRFNSRYMLDTLARIDGQAEFAFQADAASPMTIRDSADPDAIFVVMPVRG